MGGWLQNQSLWILRDDCTSYYQQYNPWCSFGPLHMTVDRLLWCAAGCAIAESNQSKGTHSLLLA